MPWYLSLLRPGVVNVWMLGAPPPPSMAHFPPNLDDGELWLPSDVILDVGAVTRRSQRRHPPPSLPVEAPSAGFAYVDDLAYQLIALGLLDPTCMLQSSAVAVDASVAAMKPSSNLQGLKGGEPAWRFEPLPPPVAGVIHDGFRPPAKTMIPLAGETGHGAFPSGLAKPVLGQGRAQAMQRSPKPVGGRLVPVHVGASFGRVRGGTGVFLPRVSNAAGGNSNGDSKKKHHGRGSGGEQHRQHAKSAVGVWKKQQAVPYQSAAEMGLPQDWTY